jgi:hypothetical protein
MTKQLTRDEAIAFFDSKKWETMPDKELAIFQMEQDCLCVPFSRFQTAVAAALGREIWIHEMIHRDTLLQELRALP